METPIVLSYSIITILLSSTNHSHAYIFIVKTNSSIDAKVQ